jgi:DNA-directed RNA polymerase subunit alpha
MTLEQTRIEVSRATERYARITISPLDGGYGTTLGNALRRVLISSLPGAAIVSVRLADVYHEFSVIPHAREDTTRLLLNLKQIRFRPLGDDPGAEWRLTVAAQGEGLVTAADIQLPPDIEVANPEQPLLSLDTHDAEVYMEFVVRRGIGYSPAEERGKLAIGELPVDAVFSPVRRVAYNVTKTRVGQLADYDSLTMDVWTDGTVTPQDALRSAGRILTARFAFIAAFGGPDARADDGLATGLPAQVAETPIEELDLSVRAYNCLKRAGLTRVGEIIERMAQGDDEMLVIRNFGQKSLDELKVALAVKGFDQYLPVSDSAGDALSAFVEASTDADDDEGA